MPSVTTIAVVSIATLLASQSVRRTTRDEVGRLVARRGASDCDSPREAHLLGELHGKFGRPRDVNSSPPASAVGVAYIDGIVEGVLHHDEVPWAWLDALEGMLAPEAFAELRDVWLG